MRLYTCVVYDLRMCIKEYGHGLKDIKGDNSKEMIICAGWEGILCDLTRSSSYEGDKCFSKCVIANM